MADPTGEADRGALRLDFDRRLVLQFHGSAITSDAGLLPYRELDDALSLTDAGADVFADTRTGRNGRHRLAGLLRQSETENCLQQPWNLGNVGLSVPADPGLRPLRGKRIAKPLKLCDGPIGRTMGGPYLVMDRVRRCNAAESKTALHIKHLRGVKNG
jgi:hypothetical protein